MKTNNELINELNEVVEKNYDAIEGFNKAATKVNNSELKRYLTDYATERSRFNQELRNEINALGGNAVDEGSLTGNLHRTWMDIKTAFTNDNEEEILEECIRGEKAAYDEYQEILHEYDTPSNVRNVLSKQSEEIRRELEQLRGLEELYD